MIKVVSNSLLLGCSLLAPLFAGGQMTELAGSANLTAYAINNNGQVVGASGSNAALWDNGVITDLGILPCDGPRPGLSSIAFGINDRGQVVGVSNCNPIYSDYVSRPFLWDRGVLTDLQIVVPNWNGTSMVATSINARGQIVGYATDFWSAAPWWAFRENGVTTVLNIGGLPPYGLYYTLAYGINSRGQVVGVSGSHAFVWENGVMTDLGTLGGTWSQAASINDNGETVGKSALPNGSYHAFLSANGVMTDLGTLGGAWSQATGINNKGQIVGTSSMPNGSYHAFLWENGVMTDLGTLGGTWSQAVAINDPGQIIGTSSDASGASHVFIVRR